MIKTQFPKLFDVGSGGLHSIHGFFQTGVSPLNGSWIRF